jgi:hypothetical protein
MSSKTPISEPWVRPGPEPSLPTERDWVRRARHRARSRWAASPRLYLPAARHRHPGPSPEVIGPQTRIVVDGYTRSATTFAVYAFQLAQSHPQRMAHHLHAPAQLIEAARRGVPAIALIREPEGAILSQVAREPGVTVADALVSYARFYECLTSYRRSLVVGEFALITTNPGEVIRRVNERFGSEFDEFEATTANLDEVLELSAQRATRDPAWFHALLCFESGLIGREELASVRSAIPDPGPMEALGTWVPSPARRRMTGALHARWWDPRLAHRRARAQEAYERFVRG